MPLFKLPVDQIYGRAVRTGEPHKAVAVSVARWLERAGETLDGRGFFFESGNAEELAQEFRDYAEHDGTPEGLARLWNNLDDWGESSITTTTGREQSICQIPHLPDALSC